MIHTWNAIKIGEKVIFSFFPSSIFLLLSLLFGGWKILLQIQFSFLFPVKSFHSIFFSIILNSNSSSFPIFFSSSSLSHSVVVRKWERRERESDERGEKKDNETYACGRFKKRGFFFSSIDWFCWREERKKEGRKKKERVVIRLLLNCCISLAHSFLLFFLSFSCDE